MSWLIAVYPKQSAFPLCVVRLFALSVAREGGIEIAILSKCRFTIVIFIINGNEEMPDAFFIPTLITGGFYMIKKVSVLLTAVLISLM